MKRYVLTLAIALGISYAAEAQSQKMPTATEMATKSIEALDKKLKLNQTQKNIIYNYTLDLSKEQLALAKKQQSGAFNEDDVTKFYKLQNETTKNIKNILKGDQVQQYDDFLDEQLRGGDKKKKKGKRGKNEEEEVVTGISGLKLPPTPTP